MIIAITAFNIDRYTTVEAFLQDFRIIGLNTIELNGRVRQSVIDELVPYIERGEIRISSLHVFCPQPDVPRVLEYGSKVQPLERIRDGVEHLRECRVLI